MKLRKTFLLLVLASGAIMTACNHEQPIPDDPGTGEENPPNPDDPGTGEENPPEQEEPIVFEESDYDADLLGTFYSRVGTLEVDVNSLTLKGEDELTLKPVKIEDITENNAIRSTVFYEDEKTKDEYRIHLNYEEKMELSLEKLEGEEYVLVDDFMPSIEEFVGAYTGYGDHNMWNYIYLISNEYSSVYDNFPMNYISSGGSAYTKDLYYTKSYFQNIDGVRKTMIDIYDYEDDYLYYSLYINLEDNVTHLYDVLTEYVSLISDFGMLFGTYFVDETKTLSFEYTLDDSSALTNKVTLDGEEFDVSFGYENSTVYKLKSANRDITIKPYLHGIEFTENGVSSLYPFNNVSHLTGTYKDDELEFSFDSTTNELLINGIATDFKKKVVDGELAISATVNCQEYIFTEFKNEIAIKVNENGVSRYLVAYDKFLSNFKHSYESVSAGESTKLTIGDDFKVTYLNETVDGALLYDPLKEFPEVAFTINGNEYIFSIYELNNEIYSLKAGDETKYFFTDSVLESLRNDYTSGKGDISFIDNSITYLGETTTFDLKPFYDANNFINNVAIYFTTKEGEEHYLIFYKYGMLTDYLVDDPNPIETYVTQEDFDSFVGRYVFNGTYGPESFELTSDGKFYADVLNETGDGLILRQEKEYHIGVSLLANGTTQVTLQFYHEGMWVYLYKNAHSVTILDTKYVDERLFAVNGTFVSDNNNNVVFINRDKVYVDGTEATINSLTGEVKANGTITLNLTVNGSTQDLVFTFDENEKVKDVKLGEVSLTSANLDLSIFKGTWIDSSKNTFIVTDFIGLGGAKDGLSIQVIGTSGLPFTYTDYIVVNRNGKLALKIAGLGVNYYLIYDGTTITAESESSIPIPPPPPPPPPAL